MKTTMNQKNNLIQLLGSHDFDQALNFSGQIVLSNWDLNALAILVWDPDLETVSDKLLFGNKKIEFEKIVQDIIQDLEDRPDYCKNKVSKIDNRHFELGEYFDPCWQVSLYESGRLVSLILLSGLSCSESEIEEFFDDYPFALAIANAWEHREITRENERLRNRYEEMEEANANLAEQTRKLIKDLEVKDSLRFRTVERDKLLYELSAAVRSSVEIQPVLKNAVTSLGHKFGLSRCIILRSSLNGDELYVYEFHNESTNSVKEAFYSTEGRDFFNIAISKTAPFDLGDGSRAEQLGFDSNFIKSFGFLSALIIPLIIRDRVIGSMFLHDCITARPWSIDDLTFFGALADQLSVAVENADLHEEKKLQAVTDGLTGISNRRHFNDIYLKEFDRAKRYAEPMTLAVFDLDFLKKINDTYGHTAGDEAIKAIAEILNYSSRSVDLAARYGGEEFCLLLPNTPLEDALSIAERIRKTISETSIEGPGNISSSVGLANFPLHATNPEELFEKADQALYKAKQSGRNQVYIWDESCIINH